MSSSIADTLRSVPADASGPRRFFYSDPVHLVTEVDGTRIIGAEASEFLKIVPGRLAGRLCSVRLGALTGRARPASAQKIYLPGSTAPPALLFEAASQFYEHKSPRADEYVRSLGKGPEMAEAIEGCLDAAVREWDEREQKKLLRVSGVFSLSERLIACADTLVPIPTGRGVWKVLPRGVQPV